MAIINQSPAGQTSVAASGINFDDLGVSGTPFRLVRRMIQGPSVDVIIGSGGGSQPQLPTSGQIWPSGYN